MDVFAVSMFRALFGVVFLAPMVLLFDVTGEYQRLTAMQVVFLIASLVAGGIVGDLCYMVALRILGMSRCYPILNSYPLFTVLYSIVLLGQRVSLQTVGGGVLVLAGVYCIARRGAASDASTAAGGGAEHTLRGVLMALAAAAAYGLEGVLISLGVGDVNGIVANSIRVPVVILVSGSAALVRGALRERRGFDLPTIGSVALGGLLGWALAGSMWVASIQAIGPSKASIIGSTSPLFAVPLSLLILRERPTLWTLLGTVLTVAGIILVI